MHKHTFESDSRVGILLSSIFVCLLVTFAVIQFVSILVVSARIAFEYESCIASMHNFLVLRRMCAESQLELKLRGCVICLAFVQPLHRHQTALPHEFAGMAIIWQVKGRLEVIVEEAPTLMIIKSL